MTEMNIKEELITRLQEVLSMEGVASAMYTQMENDLESDAMKAFFRSIAEEEKEHARIVNSLIEILSKA
jgi:rubrerythrin